MPGRVLARTPARSRRRRNGTSTTARRPPAAECHLQCRGPPQGEDHCTAAVIPAPDQRHWRNQTVAIFDEGMQRQGPARRPFRTPEEVAELLRVMREVHDIRLTADDVMTSADVSELIKEPIHTVEAWARAGLIPGHKIGKRWKFIRSEIEHWLLSSPGGPMRDAARCQANSSPGRSRQDSSGRDPSPPDPTCDRVRTA